MTEWEKLQTGQLYNDFDRGLFKRRIAAKRLFRAYNRTDDDEQTERRALMEQLFGSVGKNVWVEPDFRCEFGKNITIEDNVYINFGCVILDCAAVTIGADSLLGPNIGLYAVNHATDAEARIHGACWSSDPYWQARLARRRCEGARGRHNRRRHHPRRWQRGHEGYPLRRDRRQATRAASCV